MIMKKMGGSGVSGSILEGRLKRKRRMWVGEKSEVRDEWVRGVGEDLGEMKKEYWLGRRDGKFVVVRGEVEERVGEGFK